MNINYTKIKAIYQDKITNNDDIFYIFSSIENKEEQKEFFLTYKSELIFNYQEFYLFNLTLAEDIEVLILNYLKDDILYLNIFNLIIQNIKEISLLKTKNDMLIDKINFLEESIIRLQTEITNIYTRIDYIDSPSFIYTNKELLENMLKK